MSSDEELAMRVLKAYFLSFVNCEVVERKRAEGG